ncbi:MAG TPA: hypothetical protein VJ063_08465 [Verrucomicrobiae bacterium]|nr:hypothetical protein [Verrucomicrobiae bacterium]
MRLFKRGVSVRSFGQLALSIFTASALSAFADANSWLKASSGNWEEPQWSQGILPNYGHAVMITNAGWKAVQIAPSTAQYFPDTLTVYSINVASPVDSYNTLLLNYAGFDHPLTVSYSITVGPGAAMTMLASGLRLNGPTGVGLSIGGEFNQNDGSQVIGNQADVGWAGPGIYNLNSGTLKLEHLWVGGPNAGVFNQNGGSNSPGILHFEGGGTYNLRDGDFNGTTYFADNALFQQDGGLVHSVVGITGQAKYVLNRGLNYGGVTLSANGPVAPGGWAVQNGGTNFGPISIGSSSGAGGSYIISNGVISSPSITLGMFSGFHQAGGVVTTPGAITLSFGTYNRGLAGSSSFQLDAGFLSSTGISLDLSHFQQNGGTNQVAGDLRLRTGWYGSTGYALNSGMLITENVLLDADNGGFFQNGGTHLVRNTLSILGRVYNTFWKGYEMTGGELIVSNLFADSNATLRQTGGAILVTGTSQLRAAQVFVAPGLQQFGTLQLVGLSLTNVLSMPAGSAVVRFNNSSAMGWAPSGTMIIDNWAGSYLGGGQHRILFGNNTAGLTPTQLHWIYFRNPAEFAYGTYPTKILPTGEIVPDGLPATGHNPAHLAIRQLPDSTVQITATVDPGYKYGVLSSYDLQNWNMWTNRLATNGTFTVVDSSPVFDWPFRRFYKAVLMQ